MRADRRRACEGSQGFLIGQVAVLIIHAIHAMQDKIYSAIRHAFTGWILAAVLFLTAKLSLTPEQSKTLSDALTQIGSELMLIIITLAPVVGRILWAWVGSAFRRGSGESVHGDGSSAGPSGGVGLWIALSTAALCMGALPSCSPAFLEAARAVPIRIGVETDYGRGSYSSKGGIELDAVIRAEK